MPLNRAVVLAAGLGTRMRQADPRIALDSAQAAAADAGLKAMVPVPRPFLDYVLSGLADAGISEVCIVVAPGESPIRKRYAAMSPRRIGLSFAVQAEPRGTADAVLAAEGFASESDFLILNSDNYYPVTAYRALLGLPGPGLSVFEREILLAQGNFPAERVNRYATLRVDLDGFLERIEEKPAGSAAGAPSEPVLLSMNLWRFSPAIFEACRRVPLSVRGELELPQAVRYGMDKLHLRFRAVPCAAGVLDLSTRADIASVARRLRGVEVRL